MAAESPKSAPRRPPAAAEAKNGAAGILSPRFRSVADLAGWDEESILLAALVVEDTPVRESRRKRRPSSASAALIGPRGQEPTPTSSTQRRAVAAASSTSAAEEIEVLRIPLPENWSSGLGIPSSAGSRFFSQSDARSVPWRPAVIVNNRLVMDVFKILLKLSVLLQASHFSAQCHDRSGFSRHHEGKHGYWLLLCMDKLIWFGIW